MKEKSPIEINKIKEERLNLNNSEKDVNKIYPITSRLSFTDAELKVLNSLTKWKSYETATYEQPVCCSCCGSWYFKLRWAFFRLFSWLIPFTSFSFGSVLFFLLLLLIGAGAGYLVWDEVGSSGELACFFLALAFALPTRNSFWLFLTGIPYERVLFWHKLVARLGVGIGIYHGVISHKRNWSGIILVSLMGSMSIFSFYLVRRHYFEFFYRFHWILFILIIAFIFIHDADLALIGVGIWLIDFVIRFCLVRRNKNQVNIAEITQIPTNLIKICYKNNNFNYKAGQYAFVCVPSLSMWEWHPFSFSSSPNEKNVSLHVRVLGDWTKRLYDLSADPLATTKIWIDGPYGNCALNIDNDQYKIFMLISGGIGITPLQSICNQLIYEHLRGRGLKKILFIWSVKDKFLYDTVADNPEAYYIKKLPSKLPFSFQPDVMIKHEHEHVLESCFHLTSIRNEKDYNKANINPKEQKLLKFGRPNLPSYFEKIKKIAKEQKEIKVAVLCCGPAAMMDESSKLSRSFSGDGVTFKFHKETFNF